jgi:hypothetical protein
MSDTNKMPLQSKKFLAYLISEITTKAGMFYMLMHLQSKLDYTELALLIAMLVSSSALTVGYVLGVASLEKYLSSAVEILDRDHNEKEKK